MPRPLLLAACLAAAASAQAAVIATPDAVGVFPGNVTPAIRVDLLFTPTASAAPRGIGMIVVAGLPPGAYLVPADVSYAYNSGTGTGQGQFQIATDTTTPPGTYALTLTDRSKNAGSATVMLAVFGPTAPPPSVSSRPPPVIVAVQPPIMAQGTPTLDVRILGRNFDPAAQILVDTRGVQVLAARVVSPALAEITLAARDDAALGSREIRILNPDGQETRPGGQFTVTPPSALAGEVAVVRAAVLFPSPGAFVGATDRVIAKGLIVLSGAGTIIGSWRLDGVPFDRFVLYGTGGIPLHVKANLPIPVMLSGEHRLELAIESPQVLLSSPLTLLGGTPARSTVSLLDPPDGAPLAATTPPTFRWTLVPGATGYEVEIRPAMDGEPRRFRTAEARWTPSARVWDGIAEGTHRWRVRPVFLDDTPGDLSDARAFVLTAVAAATKEETRDAEVGSWRVMFAAASSAPTLSATAPSDGSTVADAGTTIAAQWTGTVEEGQHTLTVDGTDVTAVATWTETSVTYVPTSPLADGAHVVILALGPTTTAWSFAVATGYAGAPPVTPLATPSTWGALVQGTLARWQLPEGTATGVGPVPPTLPPGNVALLQLGLSADLTQGSLGGQATADLSTRHDMDDPQRAVQENRNWLATGRLGQGVITPSLRIGLGAPTFSDQAELASTGLPRIGVEGALGARFVTLSGYQSLESPRAPMVGAASVDQTVRGLGLTFGREGGSALLRASRMEIDTRAGPFTTGSTGTLTGLFGRFAIGTHLTVVAEAAQGAFTPSADEPPLDSQGNAWTSAAEAGAAVTPLEAPGGSEPVGRTRGFEQKGKAWRAGLMGVVRHFSYSVNVRWTEATFRNPATAGFTGLTGTAGGGGDMLSADVMISQGFSGGTHQISANLRHIELRMAADPGAPTLSNEGLGLTLTLGAGRPTTLTLAGIGAQRRGDAYVALGLPATDARDLGGSVTLARAIRTLTVSAMGSYQDTDDAVNPYGNMRVAMGMLSALGAIGSNLTLSAMGTATRSEGDPAFGTTQMLMASAQPIIQVPHLRLLVQPALVYSRSRNTVLSTDTSSESYGGLLTWNPGWVRSLVTIQMQADWNRQRTAGQIEEPQFTRRLAAVLTLRWSLGRGAQVAPAPTGSPMTPAARPSTVADLFLGLKGTAPRLEP